MKGLNRPALIWLPGLLVYSIAAWASAGYFHPDEHFQILEFAHYLLGQTQVSELPWEFHERIRPGLQPVLAAAFMVFFRKIGLIDPFWLAFLLRWITGMAHLAIFYLWIKQLTREAGHTDKIMRHMVLGVCFLWFMPFLHVRFSSEAWSGLCLLASMWFLCRHEQHRTIHFFLAGFFIGLSFEFRYQIAFAGIGMAAWIIIQKKNAWPNALRLLAGAMPAIMAGALADRLVYGVWAFPPWNYFYANIVEGKASWFGVSPWWYYVPAFMIKAIPPLGIFLTIWLGAGVVFRRKHLFVWVFIPFFLGHSLIGHKELRFLFPMTFIVLVLAVWGRNAWRPRVRNFWRQIFQAAWKVALAINVVMLAYVLSQPAEAMMPCYRYLYHHARSGRQVYALGKNPYEMVGLPVRYYEPPGLRLTVLEKNDSLPVAVWQEGDLLVSPKALPPVQYPPWKLQRVFSTFPEWVLQIKWNNWQERTQIWSVYEIKRAE